MSSHRTTGLDDEQFDELLARVEEQITWDAGTGRPRALTLRQALKATLLYKRHNMTEEVIADIYDVSQGLISAVINTLETIIAEVLASFVPDPVDAVAGRVVLVDGTLCPCWSWRTHPELRSGKHATTGHNAQVVADVDANILVISEPCPGAWHDARAYDETGLWPLIDTTTGLGDRGYIGTNLTTPKRKPRGEELSEHDATFNRSVNTFRAAVENAIADLKTWRVLHTDFRRPLRKFATAFRAVAALYFFSKGY